nr:MAG TPA: hypothetical protein [Caudoviricetes sp.]
MILKNSYNKKREPKPSPNLWYMRLHHLYHIQADYKYSSVFP